MEQMKTERLKKYPALVKQAEYFNNRIDQMQTAPFIVDSELNAIDGQITKTLAELNTIQTAIFGVTDPLERLVLQLRYMGDGLASLMKWKEIATRLFGDSSEKNLSRAKRLHDRALKHLHFPIET